MSAVVVTGPFDDLRSRHVRFLQEASKLGQVHLLLWSDEMVASVQGKPARFSEAERLYLLQALRYVDKVTLTQGIIEPDGIPFLDKTPPTAWAVDQQSDNWNKRAFAAAHGLAYHVIQDDDLTGFPLPRTAGSPEQPRRKKVVVTGCYDWLHSGHVRFFEDVSQLGDVYVGVGSDYNVGLLKGPGHPLFSQDERRYMVQAVRYVKQVFINSGTGWMDAEPDIAVIKPDLYAVNEDGDKPEKRAFCAERGIGYVVLKRLPKEGLPRRKSTDLRGF